MSFSDEMHKQSLNHAQQNNLWLEQTSHWIGQTRRRLLGHMSTAALLPPHYCFWNVTRMLFSPSTMPFVASRAAIDASSLSYSTNAIPFREGTVRTSLKPDERWNTAAMSSLV